MSFDLISRSAAKDEILSWAVCLNKPHLLSKDDTLHILDTIPAVDAVEVVHCEQCLYRSQYANEEGLYKCGVITCKEGHCAMVAPYFSCIAGKKRGNDDG